MTEIKDWKLALNSSVTLNAQSDLIQRDYFCRTRLNSIQLIESIARLRSTLLISNILTYEFFEIVALVFSDSFHLGSKYLMLI